TGYLVADKLLGDFRLNRGLGHQLAHAVGELGAFADPVLHAVALQFDGGRGGTRIVGAYYLDGAAVAGAVLLNHDNTVVRLLTGANARQANHQHSENLSEKLGV